MKILLDTCALLWWTLDPEKLSETCFESLNQAESLWVSSISIWELGIKIKNKKLELPLSFENYVKKLQQLKTLEILPVDLSTWLGNLALNWAHRDPADRTIVATAKHLNAHIVTSDRLILDYYAKTISV